METCIRNKRGTGTDFYRLSSCSSLLIYHGHVICCAFLRYKNLFLYTKMRNVAGLSTTDAQKSSDMFMKCRYMDELTGGKGIVFATGTPVSNSMTERP